MKKTILWGALFTLLGTQVSAEVTQDAGSPPPQSPPAPSTTAPSGIPANAPTDPTSGPAAVPASVPTTEPTSAPTNGSTNTPADTPPSSVPAATQTIQTVPTPAAQAIDCDYKIPAEVKKVDQAVVLSWSEKAIIQAFTFNQAALDVQIQKLQACFTDQGWTGFSAALQKSGNLEAIKSQKLTVSSQIDGQALINESAENQWKVTLPLMVLYQNDKEKVSQLLSIDLNVTRKPSGDLGITQMIASPRGTVTNIKPAEPATNPENTSLDTQPKDESQ